MLMINEQKFNVLWTTLRSFYGLALLVSGLDKFVCYLVDWHIYISPFVTLCLPVTIATNLLLIVGCIELIAAFFILTKWPKEGAFLTVSWIAVIIANLYSIGMYDIILRDIIIAVGYLSFGILTDLKEVITVE